MIEKAKNKKYIVPGFIFSVVVFIIFFTLITFFIYPKIKQIGLEKQEVKSKVENYEQIKKKGISYADFKEIKTTYKTNVYLASILSKVDEKFYNNNFVNSKEGEDFSTFFNKKINEIKKIETSEKYINSQESYKTILPTYVENNYENEDGVITDLKFVTYIESILYSFNLSIPSKNITVGNLNLLYDYVTDKEAPLDTNIFYIPYNFEVSGRKSDIIDFIYFLENVGTLNLLEDGNIEVPQDNFINKSLIGYGDENILKNQIIDIERIKMGDYLDSGIDNNFTGNFIDYIKSTQGNEKLTVSIDTRFYVKGVPNYKIQQSIENLNKRYSDLKVKYEERKNSKDISGEDKEKAVKGLAYLKELESSINDIKKEKKDLNSAYKKVIEINKLLDILETKLN